MAIRVKEEEPVFKYEIKSDRSIDINPKSKSKVKSIATSIKASRRKASLEKRSVIKALKKDVEVVNKRVKK